MEQPTAMTMNFSNRYSYANGKEGWTKHVKSMQLETASFAPTFAQEILSGIIYGEGINTPIHQTLEEVERLNPAANREQAQAILICSTKIIEANLAKLPAAKVSAHVALVNGMAKDALEKLNQDSAFRKNLYDRIHDVTLTKADDNAYAAVTYNNDGDATGVKLYSMRHVPKGEEIMWDYGDSASFIHDEHQSMTKGVKTFSDVVDKINKNGSECDQDGDNAIEFADSTPRASTGAKPRNRHWTVHGGIEGDKMYDRQRQAIRACEGKPGAKWKGHQKFLARPRLPIDASRPQPRQYVNHIHANQRKAYIHQDQTHQHPKLLVKGAAGSRKRNN